MVKGKIRIAIVAILHLALIFQLISVDVVQPVRAATKVNEVKAKISATQVKVGNQIHITTTTKGVTYSSSDETVAYVNEAGIVTGKKPGTVKIKAKRSGYQTYSCEIKVVAKTRKPSIPVALDEVVLLSEKLEKDSEGKMKYSAIVKNTANKGKVKKIVYYYTIQTYANAVGGNTTKEDTSGENLDSDKDSVNTVTGSAIALKQTTVKLTAKNIKAGSKSARVSCNGDISGKISKMQLKKVELYTGKALYTYYPQKEKGVLDWGVPDTTAPKFSGWIGKNSYNGEDVYRVYYSDRKKTYNFKKYVSATDDRDGKVKFTVDTSKINWKKEGVYKIKFTAKDKAGNQSTAWAKVQVFIPGAAESAADGILKTITKESWSNTKKARAIYSYVSTHCYYIHESSHANWRTIALNGIRYGTGDCYTFYSLSRLLLTRAGIPNILISRYPVLRQDAHHYWNLAYVQGGWYHFDTTPRVRRGYFCLVTDAQLWGYSSGNTFSFKRNAYPVRATKKISRNP